MHHSHLTAQFDCTVTTATIETMPPVAEITIDFGNMAMVKFRSLTDLVPATADPDANGNDPLEILASALLHYLGRKLAGNVLALSDSLEIRVTCTREADSATVERHVRDYLRNRIGLTIQENGITYRGRGAGVER